MGISDASIIHHVIIVLLLLWLLSSFNCCHPLAYFFSLIYLYLIHERYMMRLRRKLQFEESRQANQRRVLSDSETVRWLNDVVEKMWLVCMEQIVSQKILLPIVPWFLQKYKPWTVKEAVVQHLYLGRSPPMFTEMRVLRQSTDDDHLVLELGMNFRTADDMSAILAVKLRKRLGFGMRAKLHLMGMHVEGKVLIGVKFLREWPFLGRLRVCFVQPPYFQMTVKPIFTHGLDVTVLPGIAGWLDNLLALAFEQTLVEPNMLVVDVEKFASPQPENWFSINAKESIAHAIVEVLEAAEMKPSDLNGLADPYVKGQLGPFRFRTKTQRKTLAPKWHEEFKIPIYTWESPNILTIEVCDKDHFIDDTLGNCSINIGDLRDSLRQDMWLSLHNIKMGRLHLAITVVEGSGKFADQTCDGGPLKDEYKGNTSANDSQKVSFSPGSSERSPKVADTFEHINIEGQGETGIWIHHPGREVAQIWKPRKGKNRLVDTQICGEGADTTGSLKSVSESYNSDSSSSDESAEGNKAHMNPVRRGLRKISSVFRRNEDKSSSVEEPLPSLDANLKAMNTKQFDVNFVLCDLSAPASVNTPKEGGESPEQSGPDSPSKGHVKHMAKSILKHAGNSARGIKHALSRKGSRKSKGESGLVPTERDISVESDSTDEESSSLVYAPTDEASSVLSNDGSRCGNDSFKSKEHIIPTSNDPATNIVDQVNKVSLEDCCGNDSFKSKEHIIPTSNDPATNIVDQVNKVSPEDLERRGDDPSGCSEGNYNASEENLVPNLSEENLEVDKR